MPQIPRDSHQLAVTDEEIHKECAERLRMAMEAHHAEAQRLACAHHAEHMAALKVVTEKPTPAKKATAKKAPAKKARQR